MRDKSGGAKNNIKESKKAESDDEHTFNVGNKEHNNSAIPSDNIKFYHFTRNEVNYGCIQCQ